MGSTFVLLRRGAGGGLSRSAVLQQLLPDDQGCRRILAHWNNARPAKDPEAEDEANNKYGIRPVPFQVADRYQSSLVNSYFDVLVQYGDQFEVLGFRDLIENVPGAARSLALIMDDPDAPSGTWVHWVLYDLPAEEAKNIPQVCHSFDQALEALDNDREFLKRGDVFTDDVIDGYIALKMEEVTRIRMSTHPVEYDMYYSL